MTHRLSVSALLVLVLTMPALLAQNPPAPSPPQSRLLKLAEPWPEDDVLAARKAEAEARRLFQDAAALEFALTAEFNLISKERTPDNSKQFPGVLTLGGTEIPVTLGSRGHFRLKSVTCDFVPIKVEFPRDRIAATIFEGQTSLKLGTHCQNDKEFDQYVLREYLTYRLANLVTPRSFRARLARVTYINARSKKAISTHAAMFLEHENDVARRLGGRDVTLPHLQFRDLDQGSLTTMMLLEFMLGNVDYSIWGLHNVVIVQDKMRRFYPVPYDFDMSGMVRPPYFTPDPRLPQLRSVTDRLYRGPCRSVDEFFAASEPFRSHKAEMMAAIESVTALSGAHRSEMKDYLERFFRTIEKPESIKKTFVDGCHLNRTRV